MKKETKIRIKQFFCNHDYIYKGSVFDEEGKLILFYLKCKKCWKMKKVNGPFKEVVL